MFWILRSMGSTLKQQINGISDNLIPIFHLGIIIPIFHLWNTVAGRKWLLTFAGLLGEKSGGSVLENWILFLISQGNEFILYSLKSLRYETWIFPLCNTKKQELQDCLVHKTQDSWNCHSVKPHPNINTYKKQSRVHHFISFCNCLLISGALLRHEPEMIMVMMTCPSKRYTEYCQKVSRQQKVRKFPPLPMSKHPNLSNYKSFLHQ